MTEIPEHLRKRAEEARKKAAAPAVSGAAEPTRRPRPQPAATRRRARPTRKIPAHLLERAKKAREGQGRRRDRRRHGHRRRRRSRRPRPPPRWPPRRRPSPPAPAGTPSACSRSSSPARSRTSRPRPQDKVHVWPHLLVVEFVAALALHRVPARLLDLRQRPAARAGQLQPDAEPVEGAVVLPRPPGAAHDVPPDGRRRDHPGHGPRSG